MAEASAKNGGARAIGVVLGKEFVDNVRNRWILGLSLIFVALTLIVSYFGAASGGGVGFQGFNETLVGMLSIVSILVPILALMVSYASVVGEKEGGSIQLLLSTPVTRRQALLGKFLGLSAVIITSIVAGLGIAGIVIMAAVGTEDWPKFLAFVGGTILFALVFVSLGFLLSTTAKRRSVAVGLALLIWFAFSIIWSLIMTGLLAATGQELFLVPSPEPILYPDWFYIGGLVNPAQAFGYFAALLFDITGGFGFFYVIPDFVTLATTSVSMVLWTVVPLVVALWIFQRQDL